MVSNKSTLETISKRAPHEKNITSTDLKPRAPGTAEFCFLPGLGSVGAGKFLGGGLGQYYIRNPKIIFIVLRI